MGHGIAAAAAYADDFDDCVWCELFDEFKHFPSS
jgi:hypothetical protein